jgi:hypothetical protein
VRSRNGASSIKLRKGEEKRCDSIQPDRKRLSYRRLERKVTALRLSEVLLPGFPDALISSPEVPCIAEDLSYRSSFVVVWVGARAEF